MNTIWSPLSGRRALVLGDVSLGLIRHVAGRYEDVVVLNTTFRPPTQAADLSTLLNTRHAELDRPPFPWDPGYFEGLFSLNFLFPHVNWQAWLREGLRVLKPRGRVLIVEPLPFFERSMGSTVKLIKLWKDVLSSLPPKLTKQIVSPDEINQVLKECDVHHIRMHSSLDDLGSDARDWLPSAWVRETFLNHFLPAILEAGIDPPVRARIEDLSRTFAKRPKMDLPTRIFSGVKRKAATQPFQSRAAEQPEREAAEDVVSETAEEQPEGPIDSDPWKMMWSEGPEAMTDIGLLSVILTE